LCGSVARMVSTRSCCGRSGSRCCRALISDCAKRDTHGRGPASGDDPPMAGFGGVAHPQPSSA
jgi:hypothetical protein